MVLLLPLPIGASQRSPSEELFVTRCVASRASRAAPASRLTPASPYAFPHGGCVTSTYEITHTRSKGADVARSQASGRPGELWGRSAGHAGPGSLKHEVS